MYPQGKNATDFPLETSTRGKYCLMISQELGLPKKLYIESQKHIAMQGFKATFFLLLLFKYSFLPFPTTPALPPPSPVSTLSPCYCLSVLYYCSYKPFTLFPHYPLPSPLWSLSACSQFQCLCLYFACLFVLLIRFL